MRQPPRGRLEGWDAVGQELGPGQTPAEQMDTHMGVPLADARMGAGPGTTCPDSEKTPSDLSGRLSSRGSSYCGSYQKHLYDETGHLKVSQGPSNEGGGGHGSKDDNLKKKERLDFSLDLMLQKTGSVCYKSISSNKPDCNVLCFFVHSLSH